MNLKSKISMSLLLLTFSVMASAQQINNLFVNYEGTGYTGTGFTKNMKLSLQTVGSTNPESFVLNNNTITVGKSGLYKISLSCGVTGSNINSQEIKFTVYINNNLVNTILHSSIPSTGIAEFQRQLNQGDILTVSLSKNFDYPADSGQNTVTLKRIGN